MSLRKTYVQHLHHLESFLHFQLYRSYLVPRLWDISVLDWRRIDFRHSLTNELFSSLLGHVERSPDRIILTPPDQCVTALAARITRSAGRFVQQHSNASYPLVPIVLCVGWEKCTSNLSTSDVAVILAHQVLLQSTFMFYEHLAP